MLSILLTERFKTLRHTKKVTLIYSIIFDLFVLAD